MAALTVRDFRSNMAASFNRASNGEDVLIRRNNEIFALVSMGKEDYTITPELQMKIELARQELREGKCITCSTPEELDAYLNSL